MPESSELEKETLAAIHFATLKQEDSALVAYYQGLNIENLDTEDELFLYDLTWKCVSFWVANTSPTALSSFKSRYKNKNLSVLFDLESYDILTAFLPQKGVIKLQGAKPNQNTMFFAEWFDWGVVIHLKKPNILNLDSVDDSLESIQKTLKKSKSIMNKTQGLVTAFIGGVGYALGVLTKPGDPIKQPEPAPINEVIPKKRALQSAPTYTIKRP